MKKKSIFLLLLVLVTVTFSIILSGCSEDGVSYSKIESIKVNEESIADGFLLSDFDISKILLDIKYVDTVDEKGNTIIGEIIQIPATMNMVIAEDKAQLSVAGKKTINLVYGKFNISFVLNLYDDTTKKFKVVFLNENGLSLGDAQYIISGGKAVQPTVPTKADHDFLGWKDRDTNQFSSYDNIVKDTTLIAYYAPKVFKVTYYTRVVNNVTPTEGSEGGDETTITYTETEIGNANVPRGKSALDYAPAIPVIQGYSNGRWEKPDIMKNISQKDLKFFAVYDQDTVMVTFNYKKYDAISVDVDVSYYVNSVIYDTFDVEYPGFKFVGWHTETERRVTFPYKVSNEMRFVAKYVEVSKGNDGLSYKLISGESDFYVVDGFDGAENIVVIPDEYNGIKVSGITPGVFNKYDIKEFVVSERNKFFKVDAGVLYDFKKEILLAYPRIKSDKIFNVDKSDSYCLNIADYAFSNAKYLTNINLGSKLVNIGKEAFKNCTALLTVDIPATVEKINMGAFKMTSNSSISHINFMTPSALTFIDDEAFYGLNNLIEIEIPKEVNFIGNGVFYGCKSLKNISVVETNDDFIVFEQGLYDTGKTVLYCYPSNYMDLNITDITLPETVITIKTGAFSFTKLNGICITSETIKLEDYSIIVPNLIYLRILSNSVEFQNQCFDSYIPQHIYVENEDVSNSLKLVFNDNVEQYNSENWEELQSFANDYMYTLETVEVEENNKTVKRINVTILGKRNTSENLIIHGTINDKNVTKIADYAFSEDNNIRNVVLPNALTYIGKEAFAKIPNLSVLVLNSNLKTIDERAFFNCKNLSRIDFDNNVEITSIGIEAFTGTKWYESESKEYLTINNFLVKFNGHDINATVAKNIKYIASDAFCNKTNLTKISIESVILEKIGYRAFQFCTGISSITLPESMKEIGEEAFYNCSNLLLANINVKVGQTVEIKENAFKNCSNSLLVHIYIDKNSASKVKLINSDNLPLRFTDSGNIVPEEGDNNIIIYTDLNEGSNTAVIESYIPDYTLFYWIDESETKSETGTVFIKPIKIEDTANNKFAGWYTNNQYTDLVSFPLELNDENTTETANIRSMTIYAKFVSASEGSVGLEYKLIDNNYAVIDYTGSDSYVIIPQKYKNKNVTAIASNAFANAPHVTSISFPYGTNASTGTTYSFIKSLGENVFDNTLWFQNYRGDFVIINDVLIKYKGSASYVEIPDSITTIASGAFYNNLFITEVIIPEGVTKIGSNMFNGCANLKKISLPANIMLIEENAFANCEVLSDINFANCLLLSDVAPNALDNTAWLNNYLDDCVLINNILYKYQGIAKTLTVMNGIIQIADKAFQNNTSIMTINIPESMERIGKYAFANSLINEIIIFAGGCNLGFIDDYAFSGCINLSKINISVCSKLYAIGAYSFKNTPNLYSNENSALIIPESVTIIAEGAFYESGLINLIFASGSKLKEISKNAFYNCTNLSSVVFNGNSALTKIGESAFEECSSFKIFTNLNANIIAIGKKAFYNCINLKKIDINTSKLLEIGSESFHNMGYVNSFNSSMVVIGNILIKYRGTDSEVIIPSSITIIYDEAFSGISNLNRIIFEENSNISTINDKAFYNCVNLEYINFPSRITSVGNDVVTNTAWLDNQIREGKEFIIIGNTLIKYNGEESNIIIPLEISIINKGAFEGVKLYNVEIGGQVINIRDGAFDGIITPEYAYVKGTFVNTVCAEESEFISAQNNSIANYGSPVLYYKSSDIYIGTQTFIIGITDYYLLDKNGLEINKIKGYWSITLKNDFPFDIGANIIPNVFVMSEEAREDYMLDIRWVAHENNISVISNNNIKFSIDSSKASLMEDISANVIYKEIMPQTAEGYLFIGWYLDSEYTKAVHYPLILESNITIYAKFASYEIGTEGGFTRSDDNKNIESYNNYVDTTIVIPTMVSEYIFNGIQGYWSMADPENGKYGTHAWSDLDNKYVEVEEQYATHYYTGAFEGHNELENIYFASNSQINTIGSYAFRNCVNLRKIILPSSITMIEEFAFESCLSLREIVFVGSSEVKITIKANAFKNCISLRSITLPSNIEILETDAFANCTSLVDVYTTDTVAATVCMLENNVPFMDNGGLLKIYVNTSVFNTYMTRWAGYADYLVEVK